MKCRHVAFYLMNEPGVVSKDVVVLPDGERAAEAVQSQVQSLRLQRKIQHTQSVIRLGYVNDENKGSLRPDYF